MHFHVFSVTDIPFFSCIPLLTVHLSIKEWHTSLCLSKELHLHFHGDIHSSVLCYSRVKCAGSLPHTRNASICNFNCKKSFSPLILLFLSCLLAKLSWHYWLFHNTQLLTERAGSTAFSEAFGTSPNLAILTSYWIPVLTQFPLLMWKFWLYKHGVMLFRSGPMSVKCRAPVLIKRPGLFQWAWTTAPEHNLQNLASTVQSVLSSGKKIFHPLTWHVRLFWPMEWKWERRCKYRIYFCFSVINHHISPVRQ